MGAAVQGHYRPCRKSLCVIVGRAHYILRDTADCLKVFIHADLAFRAHRIVEVYGERGSPRRSVCGIRTSAAPRIIASTPI